MARDADRTIRAEDRAPAEVTLTALPVAVRVYTEFKTKRAEWDTNPRKKPRRIPRRPDKWLVFDCETRIDETQRLTFGSYRYYEAGEQLEEALFVAADLSSSERRTVDAYAERHALPVLSLAQFREKLYWTGYKLRALVIGFNLPFDFSRIAADVSHAREDFHGGFSFWMESRIDVRGRRRRNDHRPSVRVKHIDSARALMGLSGRMNPDPTDLIPDDSPDAKPKKGYNFRGYLLDLRTLAFALDRRHTLESACKKFGTEHGKEKVTQHGIITPEYITYNRTDVLATTELAVKLLEELDRHPVSLRATKTYSPASIGKAYLRAMGIAPVLERQPEFPKTFLGYAQTAFIGGRTSAHIRRVPVPVVCTDFLSMYPTVNALMGLWHILTARTISVRENSVRSVKRFLKQVAADPDRLFTQSTWPDLTAFVRIVPHGDVLPCRAAYSEASHDWQVGINHVYAGANTENGIWYGLPDVVASVLLTGRMPDIVDAFRIVGVGQLSTLCPVRFRGAVPVDPRTEDFFKTVVEQRQRYKSQPGTDADRIASGLKVIANSTAYGINAEFIREDAERETRVACHGISASGFRDRVTHPERPGEYCFPPLASLITAGARLMLALLEREVDRRGGTYAMEDTDSMAIVATERGGLVPCPGGPHAMPDGRQAVRALTWKDVQDIRQRFETLNPYDRDIVSGSVLKIEKENFTPEKKQRQIYCYAISAKRYALFELDSTGQPRLLQGSTKDDKRWSEHGLGHLMNPLDPDDEERDWIKQVWERLVHRSLGLRGRPSPFARTPAVGRISVSSPAARRAFRDYNNGRTYADQIKPFSFLLSCHVAPLGHPPGANPKQFHLIAPYETDARRWLGASWLNQYTGDRHHIEIGHAEASRPGAAHVQTYAEMLEAYEFHPEAKCAGADGRTSGKQYEGLHSRRHIIIDWIRYIGKESNELEDVESGVASPDDVYTEFTDRRRDYWTVKVRPAMERVSLRKLEDATEREGRRLAHQTIVDARNGERRPHKKQRQIIIAALIRLGVLMHTAESGARPTARSDSKGTDLAGWQRLPRRPRGQ